MRIHPRRNGEVLNYFFDLCQRGNEIVKTFFPSYLHFKRLRTLQVIKLRLFCRLEPPKVRGVDEAKSCLLNECWCCVIIIHNVNRGCLCLRLTRIQFVIPIPSEYFQIFLVRNEEKNVYAFIKQKCLGYQEQLYFLKHYIFCQRNRTHRCIH